MLRAILNFFSQCYRPFALLLLVSLFGCQNVNRNLRASRILEPPVMQKLASTTELVRQVLAPLPKSQKAKVIFIGVYGGTTPSWDKAEWFNFGQWPPFREVDLSNEHELNEIAFHQSVMHVVALRIARTVPDSVTLMIRGDSEVVSEVTESLYAPGDKILLIGHSFGGNVVAQTARDLKGRKIPVEMVAYIESIWSSGTVPSNVRRAFNFYVPAAFSFCPGQEEMTAEDQRSTELVNIAVPNPRGPFDGFCAEHRNIDSDPRVWKPIVEYINQFASS
jgi:hypothetical protein